MEFIVVGTVAISIAATVAAAVLAIYFSYVYKRNELRRAEALAAELGLNFELRAGGAARVLESLPQFLQPAVDAFSPWRVSGNRAGLSVWIHPETRSYGKSSKTYLIVRVLYAKPLPCDFRAARETLFTRMGKTLFNMQDVEVGDWEFDEAVRIKASDPSFASALFSRADTKSAFLALLTAVPDAFADREGAQWERAAMKASFAQVPSVVDALSAFVRAVDSRS